MENTSEMVLLTSKDWQEKYPEPKVLDPDGWDRANFQYSWYEEKITHNEYLNRLRSSTIQGKIKQ